MPAVIIKTSHDQYPELARRELGEASRASNRAMAELWVDSMLADHFRASAHYKYGYAQRSAKYLAKKQKMAARGKVLEGGRTDLVFRGRMRQVVLGNHPLIKAFPSRATALIFGPAYFTDRPRNPRKPNMGREVTIVLASQERILAGRGDQVFVQKANAIRATKTVITRI